MTGTELRRSKAEEAKRKSNEDSESGGAMTGDLSVRTIKSVSDTCGG